MENPFITIYQKLEELNGLMIQVLKTQQSQQANQGKELMNIRQVAKLLDKSVNTIYTYTANRTIPHYKDKKNLLFKRSEILEWVDKNKRSTLEELQHDLTTRRVR